MNQNGWNRDRLRLRQGHERFESQMELARFAAFAAVAATLAAVNIHESAISSIFLLFLRLHDHDLCHRTDDEQSRADKNFGCRVEPKEIQHIGSANT
jgi:hypothetical protein